MKLALVDSSVVDKNLDFCTECSCAAYSGIEVLMSLRLSRRATNHVKETSIRRNRNVIIHKKRLCLSMNQSQ